MSQNPVQTLGNISTKQNFYFQIVLTKLTLNQPKEKPYSAIKFAVFRGKQRFQQSKSVEAIFDLNNALILNRIKLNFVILNYSPPKQEQFILKVTGKVGEVDVELGQYIIDCNSYIDQFLKSKDGAFLELGILNELKIDFQVYVERNRLLVEKLVRQVNSHKQIQGESKTQFHHQFQQILERKPRVKRDQSRGPSRSRSRQNRFKRISSPLLRERKAIIGASTQQKKQLKVKEKIEKTEEINEIKQPIEKVQQVLPVPSQPIKLTKDIQQTVVKEPVQSIEKQEQKHHNLQNKQSQMPEQLILQSKSVPKIIKQIQDVNNAQPNITLKDQTVELKNQEIVIEIQAKTGEQIEKVEAQNSIVNKQQTQIVEQPQSKFDLQALLIKIPAKIKILIPIILLIIGLFAFSFRNQSPTHLQLINQSLPPKVKKNKKQKIQAKPHSSKRK